MTVIDLAAPDFRMVGAVFHIDVFMRQYLDRRLVSVNIGECQQFLFRKDSGGFLRYAVCPCQQPIRGASHFFALLAATESSSAVARLKRVISRVRVCFHDFDQTFRQQAGQFRIAHAVLDDCGVRIGRHASAVRLKCEKFRFCFSEFRNGKQAGHAVACSFKRVDDTIICEFLMGRISAQFRAQIAQSVLKTHRHRRISGLYKFL